MMVSLSTKTLCDYIVLRLIVQILMNVLCCVDHVMRMQTAPTLKAAMNVNAKRDSRVMDTPTAQVIIILKQYICTRNRRDIKQIMHQIGPWR